MGTVATVATVYCQYNTDISKWQLINFNVDHDDLPMDSGVAYFQTNPSRSEGFLLEDSMCFSSLRIFFWVCVGIFSWLSPQQFRAAAFCPLRIPSLVAQILPIIDNCFYNRVISYTPLLVLYISQNFSSQCSNCNEASWSLAISARPGKHDATGQGPRSLSQWKPSHRSNRCCTVRWLLVPIPIYSTTTNKLTPTPAKHACQVGVSFHPHNSTRWLASVMRTSWKVEPPIHLAIIPSPNLQTHTLWKPWLLV